MLRPSRLADDLDVDIVLAERPEKGHSKRQRGSHGDSEPANLKVRGEVLRRAEAARSSRSLSPAGLSLPARARQWVTGPALTAVFETPAPQSLAADLETFGAEFTDPFGA